MWTRAELKELARQGLSRYYGAGILAVLIAGLLGAGTSGIPIKGSVQVSIGKGSRPKIDISPFFRDPSFRTGFMLLFASTAIAAFLFGLALSCFLANVIEVGKCRYFSMSTLNQDDAGLGELFGGFRSGSYLNIVKIQFLRGLYEGLWSLLFIIPGIVKHYEYYMVPYLLAEFPDMDSSEAFRLSRRMMDGNKFDAWILELSFIGWCLLGALACGIGLLFVAPYEEATFAELYLKLREEHLGIPRFRPY